MLADTGQWVFKKGNDLSWADPNLNTTDWDTLKPTGLKAKMADKNGRLEGWFRLKIIPDSSFVNLDIGILQKVWAATDIYIDGDSLYSFGNTGINGKPYHEYKRELENGHKITLTTGKEHVVAIHFVDIISPFYGKLKSEVNVLPGFFNITGPQYTFRMSKEIYPPAKVLVVTLFLVLAILFWLLYRFNQKEKHLMYLAINVTLFLLLLLPSFIDAPGSISFVTQQVLDFFRYFLLVTFLVSIPLSFAEIFVGKVSKFYWYLIAVIILFFIALFFYDYLFSQSSTIIVPIYGVSFLLSAYYLFRGLKRLNGPKWALIIGLMAFMCLPLLEILFNILNIDTDSLLANLFAIVLALALPFSLLVYVVLWIKEMVNEMKQKAIDVVRVTEEKGFIRKSKSNIRTQSYRANARIKSVT